MKNITLSAEGELIQQAREVEFGLVPSPASLANSTAILIHFGFGKSGLTKWIPHLQGTVASPVLKTIVTGKQIGRAHV